MKFQFKRILVLLFCGILWWPGRGFGSVSAVGFGNDQVQFEFEEDYMGLAAMIDRISGVNHVQAVGGRHSLWQITFRRGTQEHSLSNTSNPCTSYRIENLENGTQRLILEWKGMDWWREKAAVDVTVTVDLPANTGIAEWRIQVENRCDFWGLWDVQFPKFNGFLKSGAYDVAFPRRNWGKLFKNCAENLTYDYPMGWGMPMQFLCAVQDDNGVYMAAHDPKAWTKEFSIEPGKEFRIKTYAEDMGVPGSDFRAPFPAMAGVYRGGWMRGCKIYRQFALTAPWTSKGKVSQRDGMPQALKDVGLWMIVGQYIGPEKGTILDRNKPLIDAAEYFDVPIASHWYNWHQIAFDNNYPHYFPTKQGIPEQARDLVKRGQIIMPYINGRIVDTFNEDFEEFRPFATKDQLGMPYLEIYGTSSGRLTPMCTYTEFWQDKVAEIIRRLGDEVGVNAVYIDQIAAGNSVLCFDKSHGHPIGGGGWWVDGYREMLKKVQEAAHADGRNMIITTECAAEPYMDGVDAFLIWVKRDERSIPMMTAVYSGYSIYFSSPAWFQHGDRAWIMAQGRDFTWGCQNGWMSPSELLRPEHANKAAYLKQVGKYRVATKKFLTYGELVDLVEPTNHIETVTEFWPDHSGNPKNATLPSAQGAIWKAEDGSLGIFLVNYLNEENTIDFTIDPLEYGLAATREGTSEAYRLTRIKPEGNYTEGTTPRGTIQRSETLGPWEIRVLEISAEQ